MAGLARWGSGKITYLQMTVSDDLVVTSSLEPSSGSLWAGGPVTRHRPSHGHSLEC